MTIPPHVAHFSTHIGHLFSSLFSTVYNESFIPIIFRHLYKPSGGLRSWLRGVRTVVHLDLPVVCVCLHLPVPSARSQAIRRQQLPAFPRQWRRASLKSSKGGRLRSSTSR